MKKFGKPVTLPVVKAKIPFIFILGFVVIIGGMSILKRKEIKSFACGTGFLKNSSICQASKAKANSNAIPAPDLEWNTIKPIPTDPSKFGKYFREPAQQAQLFPRPQLSVPGQGSCPTCYILNCKAQSRVYTNPFQGQPGPCTCVPNPDCRFA